MGRANWTRAGLVIGTAAFLAFAAPNPPPATQVPTSKDAKLALFNGKDLGGFKQVLQDPNADPAKTWSVKDGVIHCTGTPAGYIRTDKAYKNYLLSFEWRWPGKGGNSGVLVHMQREDKVWPYSVEGQLEHGNAGDFWLIDGAYATVEESRRNPNAKTNVKHMKNAEKPLGEWNRYEIVCLDGHVVLMINDELVNVGRAATPTEGFICLQSEGTPIEFRSIELTPIAD